MTNYTRISERLFLGEFIYIAYNLLFVILYTHAVTKIPSGVDQHDITLMLKILIITIWLMFLIGVINLVEIIKKWGTPMYGNRWNVFLPWSRFPIFAFQFFKMIIGLAFVREFSPISDGNCGVYSNVNEVCLIMQTIDLTTCFEFSLLIIINLVKCCCWLDGRFSQGINNVRINNRYLDILHRKHFNILTGTSEDVCSICLIDSIESDQLKELPCKHKFHPNCIDQWINNNNSCPICREKIISDEELNDNYTNEINNV